MAPLPSGTVTFLFTDIEGSTRLWQQAGDAMRKGLARHDDLLRLAIESNAGVIFSTSGDGMAAAFQTASSAVAAAVEAQACLRQEVWPDGAAIRVRMGIHTGEAEQRGGDYFGTTLNRTARLMAVGHGGQVLLSGATAALLEDVSALDDLGEHRLRDLDRPLRVFQVGAGVFPPLRSLDSFAGNLPLQVTSLIGREDDVDRVGAALRSSRLVTLTGVGGVGKTRLAVSVAAELTESFPDGCWLVELAPIADDREIVKTVASAMRASAADHEALVRYLHDRQVMIVLDNCEHLLDGVVGFVSSLLSGAPGVRFLTTSREPLGLDGEVVRRVPSLSLAAPDSTVEEAVAAPALRLFVARAQAACETFAISAGNVGSVRAICAHLDGIPLAIELAATRVRVMPIEAIAARLDERFKMLGGGSHRAHERHRTLQAAVAWSYELCSEQERLVFRRLGVFPASFEWQSAEAVVGDSRVDVVGCILHLVDRSLVTFEPESGRYRLLETLRQYAIDRMGEANEVAITAERHARYFLSLTERLAGRLDDHRFAEARVQLEAELDNLRTTADWCATNDRLEALMRLARATFPFTRSYAPVDAARWYRRVLDENENAGGQELVDLLGELGYLLASRIGDWAAATEATTRSHTVASVDGFSHSPWAFVADAMLATLRGALRETAMAARCALEEAQVRGDTAAGVFALGNLAISAAGAGDEVAARAARLEAVRRAEESGNPTLIAAAVFQVTISLTVHKDPPDAQAALELLQGHADLDVAGTEAMWLELAWANTSLYSDAPSVGHLLQAGRLADQLGSPHIRDAAFLGITVYLAEVGMHRPAAVLEGYLASLPFLFESAWNGRPLARIDAALADYPDRAADQAHGAKMTRNELRILVARALQTGDTRNG